MKTAAWFTCRALSRSLTLNLPITSPAGTNRVSHPSDEAPDAQRGESRPVMTGPSSLTHTPALGGHLPLSSPLGPWALPQGQTHPGQVAEPQLQGVAQPVGMVHLHVPLETLCGAGGPEDMLQHGLCMDPVWEGRLAPLEGRGHLGMGAHPRREGDPHERRGGARNPIRALGSSTEGVYTPGRTSVGRRRGCGPWKPGRDKGTSRPAALISPWPSPCPRLCRAALSPSGALGRW